MKKVNLKESDLKHAAKEILLSKRGLPPANLGDKHPTPEQAKRKYRLVRAAE